MFSVIVPIKNQYKIVMKCLASLERHYKDSEIIIIDDGSTEENTINFLKEFCEKNNWILKRNETSLGHTKACEIGIENSKGDNFFLLNSDVIVTKNSFNILDKVLNENDDIAVVGPSTSSASGEQIILTIYDQRFLWSIEKIESFALELELNNEVHDINLVNGFCFGTKRKVFNEVGGFDKNLLCYGNEKELLIRIRKAGYRTVWKKGCYVHHFGKMSYSQEKIDIGRAQADADKYIYRKHK